MEITVELSESMMKKVAHSCHISSSEDSELLLMPVCAILSIIEAEMADMFERVSSNNL